FGLRGNERIEQPHRRLFYCRREQSLRLKTSGDHAGLVGLRTWDVLIFPARKLTVSLVDASVYRRVPCTLLSWCLRGEGGSGKPQGECKEKLICGAHGPALSVSTTRDKATAYARLENVRYANSAPGKCGPARLARSPSRMCRRG